MGLPSKFLLKTLLALLVAWGLGQAKDDSHGHRQVLESGGANVLCVMFFARNNFYCPLFSCSPVI